MKRPIGACKPCGGWGYINGEARCDACRGTGMTLSSRVIEYAKANPGLTATQIAHGVKERARLATVSGILWLAAKKGALRRWEGPGMRHLEPRTSDPPQDPVAVWHYGPPDT